MQHSADTFGMETVEDGRKKHLAQLRSSSMGQDGSSSLESTDKLYFQSCMINSF